MEGIAFAGIFLTVVVYRSTFFYVKARWGLPILLNGIGATFMSAGALMLWMFLTNDVGNAHNFSMPEVSIKVPATYFVFSLLWYVAAIKLSFAFAEANKAIKKNQF